MSLGNHTSGRRGSWASALTVVTILLVSLAGPGLAEHVEPTLLDENNPKCKDAIDDPDILELKVEPAQNGTFTDGTLTVTISNMTDERIFDWSSNIGVDGVIVKAGSTDHNFYDYRPDEETQDTNLSSSDKHEISHISFCYDTEPVSSLEKAVRNVDDRTAFSESVEADPGETVEFRITYDNTGSADATNVTITDEVPNNTTFVSCSDDCTVDGDGGPGTELTWSLGTVAPDDDPISVTFQVQVDEDLTDATTITNVASATTDEEGSIESNEVTVEVAAAPESTLDKEVRVLPDGTFMDSVDAEPGDGIEFRLTYNNTGGVDATNVTITDAVPEHSTFVSCSDDCTVDGDGSPGTTLTWELGTVSPDDEPIPVTFQVVLDETFPAGTTEIPNTATADSDEEAPTESDEVVIIVTAFPELDLLKEVDAEVAGPSQNVTYTLTFWNNGTADATNTTITEEVPTGTSFAGCSDDCTVSGRTVTWDVGIVPAGTTEEDPAGNVTLTVHVDVQEDCEICNVATIDSPDQPDGPVDSNQVCFAVGADPTSADTAGHALGLGVSVPDLGLDERFSEVNTSQEGIGQDNASAVFLALGEDDTAGLASAEVLSSTSTSVVERDPAQATTTATSTVANVSLLDGLITATTVRGVATATATGGSASTSTTGSTFEDLVVDGVAMDEVAPNTRVDLPAELFGDGSHVVLYEVDTNTSTPDAGTLVGGSYTATTNVTMIHVFLTDALPGVPGNQSAEIIVSQADAEANFPQTPLCEDEPQQAVGGHAFIAEATTDPSIAPVRAGFVSIEPTGGDESQVLESVDLADGNVTASTAETRSQGQLLEASSDATSRATVAEACLLPDANGTCLVGATGIETQVDATADAGGAVADGTTTIASLTLAGTELCPAEDICEPAPNTVIDLPGIGFVVLNEQIPSADQDGHDGLTVRAIHLVVTVPDNPSGLPAGAEVVVSESHAEALFLAS